MLDKLETCGLVGLCPVRNYDAARAGWVDLASFLVIASSSFYGQIGPVQNDSSRRKWLGPKKPGQAVRPTASSPTRHLATASQQPAKLSYSTSSAPSSCEVNYAAYSADLDQLPEQPGSSSPSWLSSTHSAYPTPAGLAPKSCMSTTNQCRKWACF